MGLAAVTVAVGAAAQMKRAENQLQVAENEAVRKHK